MMTSRSAPCGCSWRLDDGERNRSSYGDAQEGHLPTRPAFRSRWAPEPPPSRFLSKVRRPRWPLEGRGQAPGSSSDLSDIEYEMPPALWYEVYVNLPETETPLCGALTLPAISRSLRWHRITTARRADRPVGYGDLRRAGSAGWSGPGNGRRGQRDIRRAWRGEQGASERPVRIGRLRVLRR